MPELSDALHELFDAEARVYSTPSRGLSSLSAAARSARRRTMLRSGALGCVGVIAVTGLVLGGLQFMKPDAVTPAAPPSPTPSVAAGVLWDPESVAAVAAAGFEVPQCGDTYAPAPVEVGSVLPVVDAAFEEAWDVLPEQIAIATTFEATDGDDVWFLGADWGYVVTRDDVVVASDVYLDSLELMTTGPASTSPSTVAMWGRFMCDAEAAVQELYDSRDYDPQDHTEEERAAIEDDYRAVIAAHEEIPAGTYQVYAISPVVFGEQVAVAINLKGTGLSSLSSLRSDLSGTIFADDPRIAPYCVGTKETGISCNPPQVLADEVLTVEINPELVLDRPWGVAISAPATVDVP